jgi:hypothetical protein
MLSASTSRGHRGRPNRRRGSAQDLRAPRSRSGSPRLPWWVAGARTTRPAPCPPDRRQGEGTPIGPLRPRRTEKLDTGIDTSAPLRLALPIGHSVASCSDKTVPRTILLAHRPPQSSKLEPWIIAETLKASYESTRSGVSTEGLLPILAAIFSYDSKAGTQTATESATAG